MTSETTIKPTLLLILSMFCIYGVVQWQYGVFTQAYFWDELGVYSRAASHLYKHGLSLLPSSMPDELSRGHPLLCSFYFALAFKLFGCNPITAHIAAALLNMLGVYFIFRILLRYLKPYTAVLASLMVFVQPIFISQSLLVLPEMPLMVFTSGALMAYLEDKKYLLSFFLIAALQTKESALILPIAFLLTDTIVNRKIRQFGLLYAFLIPVFSFILFICIQKIQRSYFFYPLHTGFTSFDMYFIEERWRGFTQFFLYEQNRYFTLWIFIAFVLAFVVLRFKSLLALSKNKLLFIPIALIGGLCFTLLNYYLSRYTIFFLVLFYILYTLLIHAVFKHREWLKYLFYSALITHGIINWNNPKTYTDVDFSYHYHVQNMEETVLALNDTAFSSKTIEMSFPFLAVYWGDHNGYKIENKYKANVMHDSMPNSDYLIYTHPGNMSDTSKLRVKYNFYKELRSGYAFSRIYKKIVDRIEKDSL